MKMFLIREFNSKNYLSKAKDSEIVELDDIGETVSYSAELQDNSTTILSAEIVGVAELEKHKTCLRCKGRVEPLDLGLGRCAKEDCQMLQKYAVCPTDVHDCSRPSVPTHIRTNTVGDSWSARWRWSSDRGQSDEAACLCECDLQLPECHYWICS